MTSQAMVLRCEGDFGCDCIEIREAVADKKRRQRLSAEKHRAKKSLRRWDD